RNAARKSGVEGGVVSGKRGTDEVEIPGPPAIQSYAEAEDAKKQRLAKQTPNKAPSNDKDEYNHCKAEVDTFRRQREEAENRKEAHLRVVERQRIIGQAARE
ncbi:unnamed protein product, partial [Laminaria digitata]